MTKTITCLENSDLWPISSSSYFIFLSNYWQGVRIDWFLKGFTKVTLGETEITHLKPNLNWFGLVYAQLSEISNSFPVQKRCGQMKFEFSLISCKINFPDYLAENPNTQIL